MVLGGRPKMGHSDSGFAPQSYQKVGGFGPQGVRCRPLNIDLKIVSFHPEGQGWLVSLGRPHLGQKGLKKRIQQRLWSPQQVLLSLQPGHPRGPLPRPGALFLRKSHSPRSQPLSHGSKARKMTTGSSSPFISIAYLIAHI